jgi:hypothetical protein
LFSIFKRKEHTLREFKNVVLRIILGDDKEEVIGGQRKLRLAEYRSSSEVIIRISDEE